MSRPAACALPLPSATASAKLANITVNHSQKATQQAIKDAESIIARAHEAVLFDRAKMVAEVKQEMLHLVVDTTAKVAGRILTKEDQDRLASETSRQLTA